MCSKPSLQPLLLVLLELALHPSSRDSQEFLADHSRNRAAPVRAEKPVRVRAEWGGCPQAGSQSSRQQSVDALWFCFCPG